MHTTWRLWYWHNAYALIYIRMCPYIHRHTYFHWQVYVRIHTRTEKNTSYIYSRRLRCQRHGDQDGVVLPQRAGAAPKKENHRAPQGIPRSHGCCRIVFRSPRVAQSFWGRRQVDSTTKHKTDITKEHTIYVTGGAVTCCSLPGLRSLSGAAGKMTHPHSSCK